MIAVGFQLPHHPPVLLCSQRGDPAGHLLCLVLSPAASGCCLPHISGINVTPIYKKGRKDDPGNYRLVSLTSVPGKVTEQVILSAITSHIMDNQGIKRSQHGFMKGRSCLTNLISFYDKMTRLLDEGKAVDVVYLDFGKTFDTVPHRILTEKLAAHGLDERTVCWIKH